MSIKPTIVVSSNERQEVEDALVDVGFEVMSMTIPFDFLLITKIGSVARERKHFPDDFLASVGDGRFAKECAAMREESKFPGIIIEGKPSYTIDNMLRLGKKESRWSKKAIRNLIRSLKYVEGCDAEWSDNIQDTALILMEIQDYFNKSSHLSLRIRPKLESDWFTPTYEERFIYWIQGCGKGISVVRARAVSKIFRNPMEIGQAYIDETLKEKLMSIPGIGEILANSFVDFWEGKL